ncbi:hypothetical protein WDZ11_19070 [Roseomonas mucosa]|uniref:hypothetical protein n=1 Tax=Roseomonas mucosa TaxID=207340 RepID=UPI0030D046D2
MSGKKFTRFGPVAAEWPIIRLREVIRERAKWIEIDDNTLYQRVTARVRNQGIEPRDRVLGSYVKTKRQKLCKADDLLVAEIDAKVGGFGLVPTEGDGAIVSGHYFLFEIDQARVALNWLDHVIRDGRLQRQVDAVGSTNYAAIRPRDVGAFQMPLPPLAEQRAIAEVLGAVEDAIAKAEALCFQLHEAVEELAEALFIGLDPGSGHKNVDGWRASTLAAEMASIQVGIVVKPASYYVKTDGVPALRSLNVRPNRLFLGELVQISQEGHRLNAKSALRAGDVVTIRTGEPGKTAFIPDGIGDINCIDVIFSRPSSWLRGEYVSFFMNSRIAKRQIAVLQGGLAQQHLNVGEMKRIKITVPPLAYQDNAVELLNGAWARIEAEEVTLERLKSLRAALSQELLSGRIRLPDSMIARHRDKAGQAA